MRLYRIRQLLSMTAWLAGALLLGACASSSTEDQLKNSPMSLTVSDSWRGVLPCADCNGIDTRLTLLRSGVSGLPSGYALKQTYLGEANGERSYARSGDWVIKHGNLTDPNATLYQLDPGGANDNQCMTFQLLDSGALRELDCNGAPIDSPLPHQLQPIQASDSTAGQSAPTGSAPAATPSRGHATTP